jgi:hypothetical protein
MSAIKTWFKTLVTAPDSRRNSRRKLPPLVAYFWDGGHPVAHPVENISPSGFYLSTKERWLLGTLIMMTLQRTRRESDKPDCIVIAMSKVVRLGQDGVGLVFVPTAPMHESGPGSRAADRKTLDKFLKLLEDD